MAKSLRTLVLGTALFAVSTLAWAQSTTPSVRILLPERTRLLQGQQVDLILEVRNANVVDGVSVKANTNDISANFKAPVSAKLDCDGSTDWVVRADLQSFDTPGTVALTASVTVGGATYTDTRSIEVRPFSLPATGSRNVILFIGDAMGTAYRDAARLVSRSIVNSAGKNSFREGVFDDLLDMDKMPVSGFVMTYGSDSVVPDSANTGSAWATGNKSYLNAVNVFADGTDCVWRFTGAANSANLPTILDNPRVENLWQYLKRRYGYRTGIVTTADVTDATPAVEGAYSGFRQTRAEIARQYLENPMLKGQPAFDVIFGGGLDQFVSAGRTDKRDLVGEFSSRGWRVVNTATDLRSVLGPQRTLGLFRGNATPRPNSAGIAATDSNMDVAYDKLRFTRPASEPVANLGTWTDQPMLDLMTSRAVEVLSSDYLQRPFILMVEAASIDKQSHPNQAAGQIWDTIEFDRAIGWARQWAAKRPNRDTLLVVTADHDQSMSIIGVSNVPDSEYFDRTKSTAIKITSPAGDQAFTAYGDAYANARAGLPFINASTGASNNSGTGGTPGSFVAVNSATDPASSTYSTYFGFPGYRLDASGYPSNSAPTNGTLRRLAVGYRTGDHTGSSVPVTAEGPGAFLFTGYQDQTDIFFKMAVALTGDTVDGDRFVNDVLLNARYPRTFGK